MEIVEEKYLALIQIKLLKNCQIFQLDFPNIYPDNKAV